MLDIFESNLFFLSLAYIVCFVVLYYVIISKQISNAVAVKYGRVQKHYFSLLANFLFIFVLGYSLIFLKHSSDPYRTNVIMIV